MNTIARLSDEKLHELVYRLSCRARAGDHTCDELLGRLLDQADARALEADAKDDDEKRGSDQEPGFLPNRHA